jgi:glycosyltransferase involved in cell wall biosynthesis
MPDATVPELSVIIPARNEEAWIAAAIRSVVEQDPGAPSREIIVVVNATTDGTAAAAEAAHPGTNPPVRVVIEDEAGTAHAKNVGAALATGEILLFVDADSRISPRLAATIVHRATSGEEAASVRLVADGRDTLDRAFFTLIEYGKRLFRIRANMFWCRRDRFREAGGFDERMHQAEDRDLLVRLARRGVRVGHVTDAWIATSPRRLRRYPLRFGMVTTLVRWGLGHAGIGRRWPY